MREQAVLFPLLLTPSLQQRPKTPNTERDQQGQNLMPQIFCFSQKHPKLIFRVFLLSVDNASAIYCATFKVTIFLPSHATLELPTTEVLWTI